MVPWYTPMRKRQRSALQEAEANYVKSAEEKRLVWKLDMFLMVSWSDEVDSPSCRPLGVSAKLSSFLTKLRSALPMYRV